MEKGWFSPTAAAAPIKNTPRKHPNVGFATNGGVATNGGSAAQTQFPKKAAQVEVPPTGFAAQAEARAGHPSAQKPRSVSVPFSVHPLFVVELAVAFFFGKGWELLIVAISAVLHEAGHAAAASRRGYVLGAVKLMPYGALIGDCKDDMSAKDECAVALCGPLLSLGIAVAVPAAWWLFPDLYPYTEAIYRANLSLFFCNLLPVWPLDGGRVLYAALKRKNAAKAAAKCRWVGGVTVAAFAAALISFRIKNPLAYLFLVAMLPSAFAVSRGEGYRKALFLRESRLKRGAELKLLAFGESTTLSAAVRRMKSGESYLIYVFSGERVAQILTDRQFYRMAQALPLNSTFGEAQERCIRE